MFSFFAENEHRKILAKCIQGCGLYVYMYVRFVRVFNKHLYEVKEKLGGDLIATS